MKFRTVIAAGAILLSAIAAEADEGVGEAMAIVDAANASGRTGDRLLAVGQLVYLGDQVTTDAIGEAQLLFLDGTKMVIGPNSSLRIDEFLFRGDSAENRFTVRALGGTFRFISGFVAGQNSGSGDSGYQIQTPGSIIGVRGTAFDFVVIPGVGVKLVLLDGEATVCAEDGTCATATMPCELLNAELGRQVEEIEIENGRVEETRRFFRYLNQQSSLLEPFRVVDHGCTDIASEADADTSGDDVGNAGHEGAADPADSDGGDSDGGDVDGGDDDGGNNDGGDVDGGNVEGGDVVD